MRGGWVLIVFMLLLSCTTAVQATIQDVAVTDTLHADHGLEEELLIHIVRNNQSVFSLDLPAQADQIKVGNATVPLQNNTLILPLACTDCQISIAFVLPDAITALGAHQYEFARTLNLPSSPATLNYTVNLPVGYILAEQASGSAPVVIPGADDLTTDGRSVSIHWYQKSPVLPQQFVVIYEDHESVESSVLEVGTELQESTVWILLLIVFIIGGVLGAVIWYARHRSLQSILPYVPSSLLSPDELACVRLLRKGKTMSQKALAKELGWSKSKMSAVMTSLAYKQVVKREKQGRNYLLTLNREVVEEQ